MTMTLLSKYAGIESGVRDDVAIEFRACVAEARSALTSLAEHTPTPEVIADLALDQVFRKYDDLLPADVLAGSFINNVMNYETAIREISRLI